MSSNRADANGGTRRIGSNGQQRVVELLRHDIISGLLLPRERLVEQDLSSHYGVSRTTIRSALTELAVEGLVERVPHRGARVRSVPPEEAVEILEVRRELESLCAYFAAQRATVEDRTRLRRIATHMTESVASGDMLEYGNLNRDLHQVVLVMSGQRTAATIVERLKGQVVRHQYGLDIRSGGPEASLAEHLAVVDAICAQDPDGAQKAMRYHLAQVAQALRSASS